MFYPNGDAIRKLIRVMERNVVFDIARCLAIFIVICLHSLGLLDMSTDQGYGNHLIIRSLYSFASIGVPLFVMLSGALLLGKKESINCFYKKRARRLLLPFFAFWFKTPF